MTSKTVDTLFSYGYATLMGTIALVVFYLSAFYDADIQFELIPWSLIIGTSAIATGMIMLQFENTIFPKLRHPSLRESWAQVVIRSAIAIVVPGTFAILLVVSVAPVSIVAPVFIGYGIFILLNIGRVAAMRSIHDPDKSTEVTAG